MNFESQLGGLGTLSGFIDSPDIAHADFPDIFGVPPNMSQTTASGVASRIIQLFDGPASAFGPMYLPAVLGPSEKETIDSLVPSVVSSDITAPAIGPLNAQTFYYQLTPPSSFPINGTVNWYAQLFGTNGITTQGVGISVSTNNSTRVAVILDDSIVGDVVLYASYTATNGALVLAIPIVVFSRPAGLALNRIELKPASANLSVGDRIATSVWANYTNGQSSLLYVTNGQVTYSSSNPNVVTVSPGGEINVKAAGTATVIAAYKGFTAQTVISTIPPSVRNFSGSVGANNLFQLTFFGTVATTNVIEASTNLNNWVPLATLYNTNGFLQFLDVTATNFPIRFYRIKVPTAGSTNVLPYVWLSSQSRLTNGAFQFTLTGTAGVTNIIQASTNLTTWTSLAAILNTNGVLYFFDQSATNAKLKFYRAMIQ